MISLNFSDLVLLPIIAFVPSLVWLIFYYHKDKHPEPKNLIFVVFVWGVFLALPIYLFELIFRFALQPSLSLQELVTSPVSTPIYMSLLFLAGPLIEEFFKLAIVRFNFVKNPHFDEPSDIMVYAIVVGLGFAGIENLIFAWQQINMSDALTIIGYRAITSTLLHATATAVGGYFMARAIKENKAQIMVWGLVLATVLHSCYNYLIWQKGAVQNIVSQGLISILVFGLLSVMAVYVSRKFRLLNQERSTCQFNEKN